MTINFYEFYKSHLLLGQLRDTKHHTKVRCEAKLDNAQPP